MCSHSQIIGFDKKAGLTAYHSMEIITSVYGVFRLTLKPSTWRLFNYMPADFQMQINRMNKASLILKMAGTGNTLRIIYGLPFDDNMN
ncbi:DUF4225 domain-containing protein [Enterobacteriaceae bacterium LUAb1]